MSYSSYLTDSIIEGKIKPALTDLRSTLARYEEQHPDKADSVADLSTQVAMLASRYQDLEKRENLATISTDDAHRERSSIKYALLEIVEAWDQDFVSFAGTLVPPPAAAPVAAPAAAPDPGPVKTTFGERLKKKLITLAIQVVVGAIILAILVVVFGEKTN